jgi:hypothetical protein
MRSLGKNQWLKYGLVLLVLAIVLAIVTMTVVKRMRPRVQVAKRGIETTKAQTDAGAREGEPTEAADRFVESMSEVEQTRSARSDEETPPEPLGALDPLSRRYVLREMLKNVRSVDDLEELGIDQAIMSCRSAEAVYDILNIILETDEPWAREYVVKLARSTADHPYVARPLLFTRDEPWAHQALREILDSARGQEPWDYKLMMQLALDAGTEWANELCRNTYFSASAEERCEWARELLSGGRHLVGNDDIRRELFNEALLDSDPAVVQAAVRFLIFQSQGHYGGGSGWASELLTNTFDRGDRPVRLALLRGLQEELVSSVTVAHDPQGRQFGSGAVTAINDLLDHALKCQDSTVRELAEDISKNLDQMVDAESIRKASAEYAQELRAWASQLSE